MASARSFGAEPRDLDRAARQGGSKLKAEVERLGPNITPDQLPEAHIRGDVNAPYRCIGGTIYTMQQAVFARVGFISEPPPGGNPRA